VSQRLKSVNETGLSGGCVSLTVFILRCSENGLGG